MKVVGDFFIGKLSLKNYFCNSKFSILKLLYSILISILLLVPSLSNVFIYLNFKIHQDEIVKNLCIQREMKDNKCNGHCFLSKQLKKAAEKDKKEAENLRDRQELVYIISISELLSPYSKSLEKIRTKFHYNCGKNKIIPESIFRPPLV